MIAEGEIIMTPYSDLGVFSLTCCLLLAVELSASNTACIHA